MSSETLEDKLLVEEYKACRDLIAKNIDIIETAEVYAVGAAGASAAFAIASASSLVAWCCSFLPAIITLLGWRRWQGIDVTIGKLNDYLITVEKRFRSLGWTSYYRDNNEKRELKHSRESFWRILAGFSAATVFIVSWAKLSPHPDPEAKPASPSVSLTIKAANTVLSGAPTLNVRSPARAAADSVNSTQLTTRHIRSAPPERGRASCRCSGR